MVPEMWLGDTLNGNRSVQDDISYATEQWSITHHIVHRTVQNNGRWHIIWYRTVEDDTLNGHKTVENETSNDSKLWLADTLNDDRTVKDDTS